MLVADLYKVLDGLAPFFLAESWDNTGILIGDEAATVKRILVALELTDSILDEAVAGEYDTIVTHHPAIFMSTITRLVESDAKQRLLRRTIKSGISVIACHTNLDSAPGGIADVVGEAVGLQDMVPLVMSPAGWYKLVGFVPPDALPKVAEAVFQAGAGRIGEYSGCSYHVDGEGTFIPGDNANPVVGARGQCEAVRESRWETVVPKGSLDRVIAAYLGAHPYEEPAYDIYPIEDRVSRAGLGRLGRLEAPMNVADLAVRLAQTLGIPDPLVSGAPERIVTTVAVVPGSGGSLLEDAARAAQVYITGDLKYHDAERAASAGLSLISARHSDLEWAAMKIWARALIAALAGRDGVEVSLAETWESLWTRVSAGSAPGASVAAPLGAPASADVARPAAIQKSVQRLKAGRLVRLWTDGGSRGNPGPSAFGVVIESGDGQVLAEVGECIGETTNNVAEYKALIEGLRLAKELGATEVEAISDSELLVKQMLGQYRVKNEGLKDLFSEAKELAGSLRRFAIRHSYREENTRADALVNKALDEAAGKGKGPGTRGKAVSSDEDLGGLF